MPPLNDDQVWKQMLRYLDGTLPDTEVEMLNRQLKDDPQLRELFGDLILQQIKLQEIAQEEQIAQDVAAEEELVATEENIIALPQRDLLTERVMNPSERAMVDRTRKEKLRKQFQKYRVSSGLAMVASLALIGAAVWFFFMPEKLATLAMADPGVIIERGSFELKAEPGMSLRVGDRVITPKSGRAMFAYDNEPTEITVHSDTRLGVALVREGKRLTLNRGAFVADVAKQDPNRPLSLVTPQAEAIVVGTRFKLSSGETSTKLEVFEGAVRVMQSQGGPSMQVPAGHFVNVEAGKTTSLLPLPTTRGGVQLEHWTSKDGSGAKELRLNQLMFSGVGAAPGGSRVRGYLHPPLSGAYVFQMSANAEVELKVSGSLSTAEAKTVAATERGSTGTVSSEAVLMQVGQKYYFELNCDSETLPVNFTVSWKMPGGKHRVVYGEYLSPLEGEDSGR